MVIRVFFAVLLLCTLAVVAVILAVHFRVKRHLQEKTAASESRPELDGAAPELVPQVLGAGGSEPESDVVRPETTSYTSSS